MRIECIVKKTYIYLNYVWVIYITNKSLKKNQTIKKNKTRSINYILYRFVHKKAHSRGKEAVAELRKRVFIYSNDISL